MNLSRSLSLLSLLAAAPFVAVACSDDDPSPLAKFAEAYCDLLMPCCREAGLNSNPKNCRTWMAWAGSENSFDEAKGNACLAAMRAASSKPEFCTLEDDVVEDDGACDEVFTSAGTVQPGGACEWDEDCADSPEGTGKCQTFYEGDVRRSMCIITADGKAGDAPCIATRSGSFTVFVGSGTPPLFAYICDEAKGVHCDKVGETYACVARPTLGEPCSNFESCVQTAFCDPISDTCVDRLPPGEACTDDRQCVDSAFCEDSSNVWTCTAKRPAGATCTSFTECASGWCEDGKCDGGSANIGLQLLCGE